METKGKLRLELFGKLFLFFCGKGETVINQHSELLSCIASRAAQRENEEKKRKNNNSNNKNQQQRSKPADLYQSTSVLCYFFPTEAIRPATSPGQPE